MVLIPMRIPREWQIRWVRVRVNNPNRVHNNFVAEWLKDKLVRYLKFLKTVLINNQMNAID